MSDPVHKPLFFIWEITMIRSFAAGAIVVIALVCFVGVSRAQTSTESEYRQLSVLSRTWRLDCYEKLDLCTKLANNVNRIIKKENGDAEMETNYTIVGEYWSITCRQTEEYCRQMWRQMVTVGYVRPTPETFFKPLSVIK